jgi:GNAT superfamily N-acetyltransferase
VTAPALCLTVTRRAVRDVWDDLQPMLAEHWREIAHYDDIPLNPDRARYEALDDAGLLRVFVADIGGGWVGYAVYVVQHNAHYADSLQAVQDVLYLDPEFRSAGIGRALIDECDKRLRAEGVQVVYQHVKLAHDFGPLLASLGYEAVETIHARRLDR